MKYLKALLRRIASIIRLTTLKLFHPSSVKTPLLGDLASLSTHFNLGKNCHLSLGKVFQTRRDVEFTIRDGAKMTIGNNCFFNRGCLLVAREKITIGNDCSFGPNTMLFDHDHDFRIKGGIKSKRFKTTPIKIGDNVWLGANVTVLKGVSIGDNSIIGAGAVITKDIPANSVVIQKADLRITEYKPL